MHNYSVGLVTELVDLRDDWFSIICQLGPLLHQLAVLVQQQLILQAEALVLPLQVEILLLFSSQLQGQLLHPVHQARENVLHDHALGVHDLDPLVLQLVGLLVDYAQVTCVEQCDLINTLVGSIFF